jgi:hypothetical protein
VIPREKKQSDSTVIERQLVQVVPDVPRAAYNRSKFLDERKTMMQQRADCLDQAGVERETIPLPGDRT